MIHEHNITQVSFIIKDKMAHETSTKQFIIVHSLQIKIIHKHNITQVTFIIQVNLSRRILKKAYILHVSLMDFYCMRENMLKRTFQKLSIISKKHHVSIINIRKTILVLYTSMAMKKLKEMQAMQLYILKKQLERGMIIFQYTT